MHYYNPEITRQANEYYARQKDWIDTNRYERATSSMDKVQSLRVHAIKSYRGARIPSRKKD